ncbi:MAG: glucokinase [Vicinamibacterales bacterium]
MSTTPAARSGGDLILAGDVGGTKTLLGIFDPQPGRPVPLIVRAFVTTTFANLTSMVAGFIREHVPPTARIGSAAFGVAGPVLGATAGLTNVPFSIDAVDIQASVDVARVALLNDLEAMAYAVPVLAGDELHVLQAGTPTPAGNMGLIAAGTGLGESILHRVGGRLVPSPTEAGHADWAPRTPRDIALLQQIVARHGRAEVEDVVSGKGFPHLHRATHAAPCTAGIDPDSPAAPALLTAAALERRCPACVDALDMFVEAYGAEAGNLALRAMSTAGLFVGGGIAPKILPALTDGRFLRAFHDKGAMRPLVERMPVHVILNAESGLLGAAVYAAGSFPANV